MRGHPPRQIREATSPIVRPGSPARQRSPAISDAKATSPLESPDSQSDMGRIRTRATRPAPECSVMSSGGFCEPVSRKCPNPPRRSQAWRIGFHMPRTNCHSSSSLGSSPARIDSGSTSAAVRMASELSSMISLRANLCPVQVLPQPLGPSMSTAGAEARASATSSSTTRARYAGLPMPTILPSYPYPPAVQLPSTPGGLYTPSGGIFTLQVAGTLHSTLRAIYTPLYAEKTRNTANGT
jgi:hypothetical protein